MSAVTMKLKKAMALWLATTALVPVAAMAQDAAPAAPSAPEPETTTVVVKGKHVPATMRRTAEVASFITTEDLKRTGDDNAAIVLTRVTGLSLVEGKFVYVRGLGERYSSALLNGSPLPSPEPLQRVVPLDLFPASILNRVAVQKTYSADYPAEFGGGVIDLKTLVTPKEPFVTVGIGTGGNTQYTFGDAYTHYGSDTDPVGFDNGTRDMPKPLKAAIASRKQINSVNYTPTDLQAIGQSFTNAPLNLIQQTDSMPANFSFNVSGGTRLDVHGGRFGIVGVFDFSNSWSAREGVTEQGQLNGDTLAVNSSQAYGSSNNNVSINGLLGLGFEKDGHSLQWTNLYIRKTTKHTRVSNGTDENGDVRRKDSTGWYERELKMTQLAGVHPLGDKFQLNWAMSAAQTTRDAPYEKEINYFLDVSTSSPGFGHYFSNPGVNVNKTSFSNLEDNVQNVNASLTYNFSLGEGRDGKIIGGFDVTNNDRNFENYDFRFFGTLPLAVTYERVDFLLSDVNIGPNGLQLQQLNTSQGYDASLESKAAFIKVDVAVLPLVRVAAGLRYEEAEEKIALYHVFDTNTPLVQTDPIKESYVLPSATATWNFRENMQLRFGASKTIGRPQFRELAIPTYYDVDSNRAFIGNPTLKDTEIENIDGRFEWYYAPGDYFTVGVFGKKLTRPVESIFAGSALTMTYVNAPAATLTGFELDYKRTFEMPFEGAFFANKKWMLSANYTRTQSEVDVQAGDKVAFNLTNYQPVDASIYIRKGSRLQGQSDHLANLQFGWDDSESGSQATILVTYVSDRISARASGGEPDIIQEPGTQIDFVYRKKITVNERDYNVSLEARNLTNTEYREYQEQKGRVYIDRYEPGSSISLSLSTSF